MPLNQEKRLRTNLQPLYLERTGTIRIKSAEQVDKGLYGTLIVEPKEGEQVDRDYTLVLDEWMSQQQASTTEQSNHTNMHHGNSSMMHDMSMYDISRLTEKAVKRLNH